MPDIRDTALALVDECRVSTLATSGPGGPWASPVFYAPEGFTLTFVSSPRSHHARNLATDPRCSVAIHAEQADWRSIRGLQMSGRVDELGVSPGKEAMTPYLRRFPFIGEADVPEMLRRALAGVTWYRFRPDSVHLVDNSRGFGRIPVDLEPPIHP